MEWGQANVIANRYFSDYCDDPSVAWVQQRLTKPVLLLEH